jgi:hypothetical protein
MSWGKIDDQFHAHRKAKKAWKADRGSLGLHLLAISYCAGHLTDGLVDHEFVEEKLPVARDRVRATKALVDAGLWVPEGDDWRINDWLEYNPSRAEVVAKRERDSARKKRGVRVESERNPDGIHADSAGSPNGVHTASRAGAPGRGPAVPDPTHPTAPLPPTGGRTRDRISYEGKLAEFSAAHFPGAPAGLVAQQAELLRRSGHEPTVHALRPLVERWQPVEATA